VAVMTDFTLCGGCGVPIHHGSTGDWSNVLPAVVGWLDAQGYQWCWHGQRHYPMSVTQSIAKRALGEKESRV
jgi:hypothetical protein